MTGSEAAGSGNLVVGCCVISGKSCCVLFYSGVTQSFVSESSMRELGLVCRSWLCQCMNYSSISWYLLRHLGWLGLLQFVLGA